MDIFFFFLLYLIFVSQFKIMRKTYPAISNCFHLFSNLLSMKLKASFVLLFICSLVKGQAPLFADNFNFTGALTANGYTAHSSRGVNPISTAAGLSFAGYEGSGVGNAARIGNASGEDVNRTFSSQSTNGQSVYFSLLVNVNELSTAKSGDIFFHTGSGGGANWTAFSANVAARVVSGNVNFGITNSSTVSYGTTNFSRNTTYLLVVKYTIATGAANDPVSLWVIPTGIPATEIAAGTPLVRNTTTAGTNAVNAVGLRQGAKNTSPSVIVDGIRVGTSWSSILPQSLSPAVTTASVTSITSSSALAGGNVTAEGGASVTRRGLVYSTSAITDTNSISGGGKIIDASGGTGAFTANLVGLSVNTTYHVRAFAVNAAGVGYGSTSSFTTSGTTVPSCASAYDTPWNNDYQGTSYFPGPMSIPFNTDVNGRIETSNDRDYYKFTVTTGGTISMTLTNLPANYNLNLVNSLGNSIATSTQTGTISETINATVTSNTVYYALVYGPDIYTFNANSCYTLRVNTGTASRPALASGAPMLYPNPAREFVNLRVPEVRGVMQIRVLNSVGAAVIRQNTTQPITALKLDGLTAGIYWVEVLNSNDGRLVYRGKLVKR
jgi:hypothetical protein